MLLDMLGVRKELKKRTDQIIAASKEWNEHAEALTKALLKVVKRIEEGEVDAVTRKTIKTASRALSKDTKKLSTALGRHQTAMGKLGEVLSDET